MKALLTSFALAKVSAFSRQSAPEPNLKPGSAVTLEAPSAAWVLGEAPTAFEPGNVYRFECWATWCSPWVASIPHFNELHQKYDDKGLRVFDVNATARFESFKP